MQSSALSIVENMCDIIAYAHLKVDMEGKSKRVLTIRSDDNSVRCGSRFSYIKHEIEFSYQALTEAIGEAIDKEATNGNANLITNERIEIIETPEYDFEALGKEFADIVGSLMNKDPGYNGPRVTQIVERYLGKNKKFNEMTPDQAEFRYLIVSDIKDELVK